MKEEHKNIPYRRPDETISLDELKSFLWGAATRLRGQIDAAGYKEYIFPLLFFKRISDVYDEQFEDFVAEGGEEYAGMQAAELAIRIPDGAHWRDVYLQHHGVQSGNRSHHPDRRPRNLQRPRL